MVSLLSFLIWKRQGQPNPKSISEKYNPDEDSGSGFPIEPPKGATSNGYSHSGQSMHPSAFGSSRNMSQSGQSRNGAEKSYMYRGAAQSSRFSNSASVRSDSRYDGVVEASANPHWPEERINARYSHLDNGDSSAKHDWSHNLLDRPKSSHKKDEQPSGKESATVKDFTIFIYHMLYFEIWRHWYLEQMLAPPINLVFHMMPWSGGCMWDRWICFHANHSSYEIFVFYF